MSTFAVRPLRLPSPNIRAVEHSKPAAAPEAEPVEHAAELDETSRPVSAGSRELTIPNLVPLDRHSRRRSGQLRGRAS
jgi:hypothetical protein